MQPKNQKFTAFKSKREIKRWKQQSQLSTQPILIPSASVTSPLIKKSYLRSSLEKQGIMKRNTIYYSDQSYSMNCITSASRYIQQNNPEELPLVDVEASFKKKRINRSGKKSKKSLFKLEKSGEINYKNSVEINKVMTERKKSRFSRKCKFEEKEREGRIGSFIEAISLFQDEQNDKKKEKEVSEEKKSEQQEHLLQQQQEPQPVKQSFLKQEDQTNFKNKQQQILSGNLSQLKSNLHKNQQQQSLLQESQQLKPTAIKQEQLRPALITYPIQLPSDLQSIRNFFYSAITPSKRHVCLLKHVNFGLKSRFLLFSSQLQMLLSAQSQLGSIGLNYYFFIGEPKEKQDRQYMGKLRGNMFQSLISLYNRGISYKRTDNPGRRRQLLANLITIKQQGETVTNVVVPKANTSHKLLRQNWKNLQQMEEIYTDSTLKLSCKIAKKEPVKLEPVKSSTNIQSRSLTKRRMEKKAADTKPIMECQEYKQSLCYRKIYDNLYEISISEPLSVFQAFGIVLGKCKGKLENL